MGVRKHSEEFKKQVIKEAVETGNCKSFNSSKMGADAETRPNERNDKKALQKDSSLMEDPKEIKKAMEQNVKLKKLLREKELEIEILRDL